MYFHLGRSKIGQDGGMFTQVFTQGLFTRNQGLGLSKFLVSKWPCTKIGHVSKFSLHEISPPKLPPDEVSPPPSPHDEIVMCNRLPRAAAHTVHELCGCSVV